MEHILKNIIILYLYNIIFHHQTSQYTPNYQHAQR